MKTRHSVKKTKCGRITLELHGKKALQLTTLETSSSRYIADWRPKQRHSKKATPSREATRVGPFYHESIEALEAAAEAFVVRDSQFCEHLIKSSMDRWPQDPRVGVALAEAIIAFANAFSALAELRHACAAATLAELRDACAAVADWRPKQRRRKKATPSREATRVGPFYHESIEALEAAAEAFVRDSQFCEHLLKSSMDRWPQDPRVGVALAEAQLFIPKIMLHSVALWSSRLIGAFDDRRFNGLPMHFRPLCQIDTNL